MSESYYYDPEDDCEWRSEDFRPDSSGHYVVAKDGDNEGHPIIGWLIQRKWASDVNGMVAFMVPTKELRVVAAIMGKGQPEAVDQYCRWVYGHAEFTIHSEGVVENG